MVAFIEAGAPSGAARLVCARLRAPLRPRTLRDFLAFEGHLRNAFEISAGDIPAEWYEVPAYYKGLPDTVIGPDEGSRGLPTASSSTTSSSSPSSSARRAGHRRRARRSEQSSATRSGTTCRLATRSARAAGGHGPGQGQGLGRVEHARPCIVTADEVDARDRGSPSASTGRTGAATPQAHAPQLRRHDRLRLAAHAAPGRGARLGHAAAGSGLELDRWLAPGDQSRWKPTASASCAIPSGRAAGPATSNERTS